MKYQEFVEEIVAKLREYYDVDAEVTLTDVSCNNNGHRDAVLIRYTGNDRICPTIYLDNIFERYSEEEYEIDYYVQMIIQMRTESVPGDSVTESVDKLMEWEQIKDSVYPVLLSTVGNEEFLSNFVSKPFLDLSIIYEIRLTEDAAGIASCKLSNALFNRYEITREELHEQAIANMRHDGYKMEDIMQKMIGQFMEECDLDAEEIELQKGKMYVLSNRSMRHGAACLLYEDFLKEKLGNTTAFILPSSIHETLFVPIEEGMTAEAFSDMVCQVNEASVRECERLSNHCYLWDGKEQKVKMAA